MKKLATNFEKSFFFFFALQLTFKLKKMKKLFLFGGMLLMFTYCDITDYFMDESGVVKHKDGTTVEHSEINREVNSIVIPKRADLLKML